MRQLLEQRLGLRTYVFTTFGAIYAGVVEQVREDVVELRGPDPDTRVFVNLADISGIRAYDEES